MIPAFYEPKFPASKAEEKMGETETENSPSHILAANPFASLTLVWLAFQSSPPFPIAPRGRLEPGDPRAPTRISPASRSPPCSRVRLLFVFLCLLLMASCPLDPRCTEAAPGLV